jgi:hypothetical protein
VKNPDEKDTFILKEIQQYKCKIHALFSGFPDFFHSPRDLFLPRVVWN